MFIVFCGNAGDIYSSGVPTDSLMTWNGVICDGTQSASTPAKVDAYPTLTQSPGQPKSSRSTAVRLSDTLLYSHVMEAAGGGRSGGAEEPTRVGVAPTVSLDDMRASGEMM